MLKNTNVLFEIKEYLAKEDIHKIIKDVAAIETHVSLLVIGQKKGVSDQANVVN